jgi:hypothetical protein
VGLWGELGEVGTAGFELVFIGGIMRSYGKYMVLVIAGV